MSGERRANLARRINLLVPGGGLILLGRPWLGLTLALLFAALGNFALAALLVFPDDVASWLTGLTLGASAGTYAAAQFRIWSTVRKIGIERQQEQRRAVLGAVQRHMRDGAYERALDEIRGVGGLAERDLLLAYRLAQILTGTGDREAAARAWRRVRELDRHKIYRKELEAHRRIWGADASVRPSAPAQHPGA